MDIGRGIGAPFKDPSWITKALLGGVWAVIPFTGFALTGYYLDYLRNCAHGKETPLPEWSLFGRFWVRGLLASIALSIYMLPALVIAAIGLIPVVGLAVTDPYAFERGFGTAASGGACLAFALAAVYAVAVWIFAAAALTHYAMHEQFGTFFAFAEIKRRLSTHDAGYFTALVMGFVILLGATLIGGFIGGVLSIIPILGTIASLFISGATGFVGALMAAHLFGQYAARAYDLPGLARAPVSSAHVDTPSVQPPPPQAPSATPAPPAPPKPPEPPASRPPVSGAEPPSAAPGADTPQTPDEEVENEDDDEQPT